MSTPAFDYTDVPTQYVDVAGTRYAYRSLGKGDIPIVCFQHFTGTLDNWDPMVIDGLAAKRRVITFDSAGIGNSEGKTPDNVQQMASIAAAVINALGIRKCDVLGFSLGGFIAQTIAITNPQLFRKIILVGTAPQGTVALHSFADLAGRAFKLDPAEGYLYLFAKNTSKSRDGIKASQARQAARKQDRDQPTGLPAIQQQIKALTRWGTDPVTLNLGEIRQPVLIVQGSNDEMMDSPTTSQQLFEQIPCAVLTVYPDSSHGMFFQYPELFVNNANFFLDKFE